MIGAIENAIVAAIRTAAEDEALGYKLMKVESYSGQFEADEFKTVAATFPLALVSYIGDHKSPEDVQAGRMIFPQFSVIVAATHMRNQADARKGAGDKVGSVQILADVRQILAGQDLGLEIMPLQPTAADMMVNDTTRDRMASIFVMEFLTGYIEPSRKAIGEESPLETISTQWDVPPFAVRAPGAELPRPAGEADFTQTTKLPQA